jgi:hypothetical protein
MVKILGRMSFLHEDGYVFRENTNPCLLWDMHFMQFCLSIWRRSKSTTLDHVRYSLCNVVRRVGVGVGGYGKLRSTKVLLVLVFSG